MRSDGQAFEARCDTPNKNGRSLNGRSDFVWFKVLALQIATRQYNRREPTAEQHCTWSAVRNHVPSSKEKFNLFYLFEVTAQRDRLDRLPIKRDNPLPCEKKQGGWRV